MGFLKKIKIKNRDFKKILRKGQRIKHNKLILVYIENNLKKTRAGFLVSKKISKKAVVRNKLKKRLREIFRLNIERIKSGYDLVFIPLPGLEEEKFEQLKKTFFEIIKISNLFKNEHN